MDDVLRLLDELERILDESRAMPFSNKVTVDKDEIYDLIQEIRSKLPNELKQSKWVIEERNKILIDAQKEADELINDTKERASRLVEEHEITKMAYEKASEIVEQGKKDTREKRLGTIDYADQVLSITEDRLQEMLNDFQKEFQKTNEFLNTRLHVIYDNRQELKNAKK